MIDQKQISAAYYSSMPSIIIIKTPVKYFTQVRQMKGNRKHIWCQHAGIKTNLKNNQKKVQVPVMGTGEERESTLVFKLFKLYVRETEMICEECNGSRLHSYINSSCCFY